ncbi:hypothetical protein M3Y99_01917400 [Aphelenchoides fujianensis]|nr:hypothetical protein M3Y99_01917400 [Aphelenchoides fujianensis]
MRVERRACEICSTPCQSIGYKAFVCGACSIFYRRNFRNRDQIRCRKNNACDLASGNRTTCRGCRMRACRALGLRMVGSSLVIQSNGYPADDIEDDTTLPDSRTISIPSSNKPHFSGHPADEPSTSALHTPPGDPNKVVVIAGSNSISATNLPASSSTVYPVTATTTAHVTLPTAPCAKTTLAARFLDQLLPSPSTTLSDPRSVQSIHMPSTPLMNVFDPNQLQQQSSETSKVDDLLVHSIVSMRTPTPPRPSFSALNESNSAQFPLMTRVVDVYSRFEERQRMLTSIMRGAEVEVDGEYLQIGMKAYSVMENRTLRLACCAIAELLADCPDLNLQERMAILKSSILEVSSCYKYALTARVFPALDNQHMALFPGCFCRLDGIHDFMREDYERTKHVMQPLWGVGRVGISRFRHLRPSFDESAVLFAVIVYENIERLGIMKQYAATQREQLYAELGTYLTYQYGTQATSVRLVRLLSLLCDVKCYTTAYEDTYSLLGLFLPAEREAFWSNKPHVNDSQLAVLAYPPNDHNLP